MYSIVQARQSRDAREAREAREARDATEARETRQALEASQAREARELREAREAREEYTGSHVGQTKPTATRMTSPPAEQDSKRQRTDSSRPPRIIYKYNEQVQCHGTVPTICHSLLVDSASDAMPPLGDTAHGISRTSRVFATEADTTAVGVSRPPNDTDIDREPCFQLSDSKDIHESARLDNQQTDRETNREDVNRGSHLAQWHSSDYDRQLQPDKHTSHGLQVELSMTEAPFALEQMSTVLPTSGLTTATTVPS